MNSKSTTTFVCACSFMIIQSVYSNTRITERDKTVYSNSVVSRLSLFPYTHDTNKIVGGYYAADKQFPFMAVVHRLLPGGATSQCGGTVISKRWVLTAGHCVVNFPRKFFVVFGVVSKSGIGYDFNHGPGVSMMTSHGVVHPEYYHSTNDIALLYMPQDIPYNEKIQPIQLAGRDEAGEPFSDQTAYVVGWGKNRQTSTGTKALKYALQAIITNDECKRFWRVDERNICTANGRGQNACQGDSGGPLLIMRNNVPFQVGIVSFGDGNCPSDRPGVFTRVTAFTRWIESVTGIRY